MTRRMRRGGAVLLMLAGAMLASAEAAGEPTSAERETARSLVLEGRTKFKAGDAPGALKSFQAAHAIMGVPTTGLEVARALDALGQLIEARGMALAVTRIPAASKEPEAFVNARAAAAELAEKLVARIPSLSIEVKVPAGSAVAQVMVDGVAVPPAALAMPWKVNPGEHTVAAAASGLDPERRVVRVKEGESARVEITLASPTEKPVAAGEGGTAGSGEMGSDEGAPRGPVPIWAWVSGAGGLVALGVGVVFAVDYASVRGTIADDCPNDVCDPHRYDQGEVDDLKAQWNRDLGLSVGLGAVGLAGVGLAVYGIVTRPAAKPSDARESGGVRATAVVPWISVGTAGAAVTGRF